MPLFATRGGEGSFHHYTVKNLTWKTLLIFQTYHEYFPL